MESAPGLHAENTAEGQADRGGDPGNKPQPPPTDFRRIRVACARQTRFDVDWFITVFAGQTFKDCWTSTCGQGATRRVFRLHDVRQEAVASARNGLDAASPCASLIQHTPQCRYLDRQVVFLHGDIRPDLIDDSLPGNNRAVVLD